MFVLLGCCTCLGVTGVLTALAQESMMVPIHAYPAMNDFYFPTRYA
jgi:hypothetical protein